MLFYSLAFVSRQIILAYIKRKIYNLNAIIKSFSIIATYFFHYILKLYLSYFFEEVILCYFGHLKYSQTFQKRRYCREMGNSARVIVTKAQRLDEVAMIAIRRKNIERNKTAINAKQQTIRREE